MTCLTVRPFANHGFRIVAIDAWLCAGRGQILSPVSELDSELHDDLESKIGRFRQLADLSSTLGLAGAMLPAERRPTLRG